MTDRCDFSDLPEDMCAHCTGDEATIGLSDLEIAYRFVARYRSRCHNCDAEIESGEQMARTTDNSYVCARCIP